MKRFYLTVLAAVMAVAAMVSPCRVYAAVDEDFYRRMINTDIYTLKDHALKILNTQPDSSIAYFSAVAARFSPEMSDKEKYQCAASMNDLGYLHFYYKNDPIVSYSYLVRGMDVAEQLDAKDLIANLALNKANVLCTLDEYDSALSCYRKSITAGLESKTYDAVLTSLSNAIALICTNSISPKVTKDIPEIADIHAVKIPDLPMSAYTRSLLAGAEAWEKGDHEAARRHFTASLGQIKTDLTPERFRQMSLGLLANLEYNTGNYEASLKYLHQSLDESEASDIRAALYYQLNRCYKAYGDKEKAGYYLSRYVTLTDTLLRSGQAKALRDIEIQNNNAEFNRRMEHVAGQRRDLVVVICVILVALVCVIAFGIRLWISRRKLQCAYEELYRQARARTLPVVADQDETEAAADGDSEQEELAAALCRIMETSPEVFHHDFSIDSLARLADAPPRKVSQTINSRFGTNFNTFLQKYRVEEACRRLDDRERYGRQTIEAISEGLGFKSRSNFIAVFKKFTGLTPSMYQKIGASRRGEPENAN